MSIDGVGRVVATNMIITTEAFTRFDDPRKSIVMPELLLSLILQEVPSTRKQECHIGQTR